MIQLDLNHAFLKEDVKAYQDQVRAIPVFRGLHHECLEAILRKS